MNIKEKTTEKLMKESEKSISKNLFIFGLFGLTLYFIYKKRPILALLTAIPGVPPL